MKLDTIENGFFTADNKLYVNLSEPKSSPNRIAKVLSVTPANMPAYPTLKRIELQYPDFREQITAYDLDEVNENIHCYFSATN